MAPSSTIYIDNNFYNKNLGEDKNSDSNNKSYPVRLSSFRIDWILSKQNGYQFLSNLYNNENLEIYKMKTMKMLIEFLYQQLKHRIIYV